MADFLLELYSEEIPAGMQAGAAATQLERHVVDFLTVLASRQNMCRRMSRHSVSRFWPTACRAQLPDRKEEKKGPRVDARKKPLRVLACQWAGYDRYAERA